VLALGEAVRAGSVEVGGGAVGGRLTWVGERSTPTWERLSGEDGTSTITAIANPMRSTAVSRLPQRQRLRVG
jgi:hypothetical protein